MHDTDICLSQALSLSSSSSSSAVLDVLLVLLVCVEVSVGSTPSTAGSFSLIDRKSCCAADWLLLPPELSSSSPLASVSFDPRSLSRVGF